MDETERKLDFHALGLAIKEAREKKRWTQAYLGELVGRTDRTIMSIENRDSQRRQHIDRMLDDMNEKELTVIEATAEGIKKAPAVI